MPTGEEEKDRLTETKEGRPVKRTGKVKRKGWLGQASDNFTNSTLT